MVSKFDSNSLKEDTWLKGENEICSDLLSGVFSIESRPGDVLIFQVDPEMYDLTEAEQLLNIMNKCFPKNDIVLTWKGFEFKGVIKQC